MEEGPAGAISPEKRSKWPGKSRVQSFYGQNLRLTLRLLRLQGTASVFWCFLWHIKDLLEQSFDCRSLSYSFFSQLTLQAGKRPISHVEPFEFLQGEQWSRRLKSTQLHCRSPPFADLKDWRDFASPHWPHHEDSDKERLERVRSLFCWGSRCWNKRNLLQCLKIQNWCQKSLWCHLILLFCHCAISPKIHENTVFQVWMTVPQRIAHFQPGPSPSIFAPV